MNEGNFPVCIHTVRSTNLVLQKNGTKSYRPQDIGLSIIIFSMGTKLHHS